jgi:hypothetical protein
LDAAADEADDAPVAGEVLDDASPQGTSKTSPKGGA